MIGNLFYTFVRFVLTPVVCRRARVLFTLFVFACVHIVLSLLFFFRLRLVSWYPIFPVSLDYQFLNAPSVVSNVYLYLLCYLIKERKCTFCKSNERYRKPKEQSTIKQYRDTGNIDHTELLQKKLGLPQVLAKNKQFLFLIRYPPYYSQSSKRFVTWL